MDAAPLKRRRRVVLEDGPDPIDVYVGRRMRERRLKRGLSQPALGQLLGVSFQAVQKYEAAEIRLAASTLYRLSQILRVTPGYFFEGYGREASKRRRQPKRNDPKYGRHNPI